ncbi:MAG: hypothetical protein IJ763_03705 [Lachnospiraceae bacterium]|nr:hypothetical protein [Lachnospiraceae bacterium]
MQNSLFPTKAETLIKLKELVKKSYIEDMIIVHVSEIMVNFDNVYEQIRERFIGDKVIIRSSIRYDEDSGYSKMLHYNSIKSIASDDRLGLEEALKKMALMYADGDRENLVNYFDEQILIQRYSENIVISGVAFTRDFIYKRPYYMINYSDNNDNTEEMKTKWIAHNVSWEFLDYDFLSLIKAVKEIETVYSDIEALEIKFGIDSIDNIIIYQVRPLVELFDKPMALTDKEFFDAKSFAKCDYLDTSHVLSDMANWKPAEILGMNPRPLDCSLYNELITSGVWNESISNMGYDSVINEIMQKVGNKPYISVDYSIDGLTPQNLKENIKFKLKEYYIKKLKEKPVLHERLEVDLIFNCYVFSTEKKLAELENEGFSREELSDVSTSLKEVTTNIIKHYDEWLKRDLEELDKLTRLRHEIRSYAPLRETNIMKLYKYVNDLTDSIRKYGSPLYIRQSRCEIVARSLLNSLVDEGYFSREEMYRFISGIETAEVRFEKDILRYIYGEITADEFNEMYGHLRLKTYDIRTDCYKHMKLEGIFDGSEGVYREDTEKVFLDNEVLEEALRRVDLDITPQVLISFVTEAIINRAYFRFEYIKSLSLILDIIVVMGNLYGIDREDMSYLELSEIMGYHSRDSYIQIIQSRRDMYHAYSYLVLPELIFNVGDIDVIDYK